MTELPTEAVSILRVELGDRPGQNRRVKVALKRLNGVHDVGFDYISGNVQVKYDPAKVSIAALKKTIRENGV
jgi:hypothetical protein